MASSVVVHSSNPLQEITLAQLVNIYGDVGGGELTGWGQLGLTGVWKTRKVKPLASNHNNALALRLFEYTALKDNQLHERVELYSERSILLNEIAKQPTAIAIMRAPVSHAGVRVLPISFGTGEPQDYPFLPTAKNLAFREYPLRLRIVICYNPAKRAQLQNLLKRFFTAPTPAMLLENSFIPLPDRERERIVLELDIGP